MISVASFPSGPDQTRYIQLKVPKIQGLDGYVCKKLAWIMALFTKNISTI